MPYVTSIERLAKEEGFEEGLEKGLEKGLKRAIGVLLKSRFGEDAASLTPEIDEIHDGNLLETILEEASRVTSPAQLRECWKSNP